MKAWHILIALAVLGLLLWLGLRSQRILEDGLPVPEPLNSQAQAYHAAEIYQREHGGEIVPVLGTGSMAPVIPAAAPGRDPLATVVAYVVTRLGARYEDIAQGDLVLYRPAWTTGVVIHVAALQDSGGWIMSGLANRRSEPQWRVTRANFVGVADQIFTWPQAH